jgi:ABC-2 type transport system ATP-binding protein
MRQDARMAGGVAGTPAVEVRDLVKRYRSAEVNAVDGVSFTVRPGEFFALLGPNGAGKTTTVSVLTTTLLPTGGTVTVAGYDVVTQAAEVRRRSGIIFQNPSLDLNLSGEHNVRLHAVLYGVVPFRPSFRAMPRSYKDKVDELAHVLGLGDAVFRPVRTLSGGMKRKLEILRSLLHEPEVLFLDEPTSGLDPASRRDLWVYLRDVQARSGTTVLLTTHYLEEAEGADRVCVVNEGHVVAEGTPAELTHRLAGRALLHLDAEDRGALRGELAALGFEPTGDGPFAVPADGAEVHRVLSGIRTPVHHVRTEAPTLEDAYLDIIGRTEENADG